MSRCEFAQRVEFTRRIECDDNFKRVLVRGRFAARDEGSRGRKVTGRAQLFYLNKDGGNHYAKRREKRAPKNTLRYSALILPSRMTFAYFVFSALINAANSSGVLLKGSPP